MDPKEAAAHKALEHVENGMTIGLGTGSTAVFFIRALGEKVRERGWTVRGVPTSERSRTLADEVGIPIVSIDDAGILDLTVDGADEADHKLNLIKGGGGALLREKLVAAAAREFIVIGDPSKLKETLGAFPLPVAIVPFGWTKTMARLEKFGAEARLRKASQTTGEGAVIDEDPVTAVDVPFVSDDGLYIVDMRFGSIPDAAALQREIKSITGVVDVGLFVGMASRLILGHEDGNADVLMPGA